MSWEQPGFKPAGIVAGADLSAKQYYLVKLDSAAAAVESTVAGEIVLGVLQNKPTSGQAAEITQNGITPVIAGAAITKGDKIVANGTTGKVKTAAGTGAHVIGYALETASGDGVQITALLNCGSGVV